VVRVERTVPPELLGRIAEVHSHSPLDETPVRLRVSPGRVEQAPEGLMVSMVPATQSNDFIRSGSPSAQTRS